MIIGKKIEDIELRAYYPEEGSIKPVKVSDYRGKWLVVLFYPADFTFVCPTELRDLQKIYPALKELNAEAVSVSTDSAFAHVAWKDMEGLLQNVGFPMVSDQLGKLSRQFEVFDENSGKALRGVFLLDPDGVVKGVDISMYDVGRNLDEILKRLKAYQYVEEHPGVQCPVGWDQEDKPIDTALENIGKVAEFLAKK